jgi:hypothetical protein
VEGFGEAIADSQDVPEEFKSVVINYILDNAHTLQKAAEADLRASVPPVLVDGLYAPELENALPVTTDLVQSTKADVEELWDELKMVSTR